MSGIKSDKWIRAQCLLGPFTYWKDGCGPMIDPFEPGQVKIDQTGAKIVSYGTSSYGYDIRCANEFKIFTNVHSAILVVLIALVVTLAVYAFLFVSISRFVPCLISSYPAYVVRKTEFFYD